MISVLAPQWASWYLQENVAGIISPREVAHVAVLPGDGHPLFRRHGAGLAQEGGRQIDSGQLIATRRQGAGVPARAAGHVQHAGPRREPELLLEEIRLLLRHRLGHEDPPALDEEAGKELLHPLGVVFHGCFPGKGVQPPTAKTSFY